METIAYKNKGFPTRYSFYPENMTMIGGEFYSFKNGKLWLHNINTIRNNFYGEQYNTSVNYIFNDNPITREKYLTLGVHGTHAPLTTEIETDIQEDAFINEEYFEKKEGVFYSHIRNNEDRFDIRNVNGIGGYDTIDTSVLTNVILTFTNDISSLASNGDDVYIASPTAYIPVKAGVVVSHIGNELVYDSTGYSLPSTGDIILIHKNNIAESQGLIGNYCSFESTFSQTEKMTIFAFETNKFKSHV